MGIMTAIRASMGCLPCIRPRRSGLGRALGVLIGVAGMTAAASAQSPLTTTFNATTIGNATNSQVFFNLNVRNPITVTQIDLNLGSAPGVAGTISVYITAVGGTWVGNTQNSAMWTLAGSGPVVAAGSANHTVCDITDFNLSLGTYGVAVRYTGVSTLMTNNGTTPTFSTEELVYFTGKYQGNPFVGAQSNANYIWNGSIFYVPYVVAASGACCHGNATCTFEANSTCAGVFQGAGVTCASVTCTQRGGCCNATSGACALSFTGASGCPSGFTYLGNQTQSTACGGNPCMQGACCNIAGGCVLATAASCSTIQGSGTSGSTFAGLGTVCVPTNTCAQPPAPTNSLCSAAIVLTGSSVTVLGNNSLVTPATNVIPPISCEASGRAVYYSYTPTLTALYTISTCHSVTLNPPHDTLISVHSGCPGDGSTELPGACSDDNCTGGAAGPSTIPGLSLTAGTTYIIRMATWDSQGGTSSGPFALTISSEPFGVCCTNAAVCSLSSQSGCVTPNVFTPGVGTCNAALCAGACCDTATASCFVGGSSTCGAGHIFGGVNTTCDANPCPGQACCNTSTGGCIYTGTNPCPAGTTGQGTGTVCSPTNPCGETCCFLSGQCIFVPLGLCPAGTTPGGLGSTCIPNFCPAPTPPNDGCADAITLTAGAATINGTTFGSSSDTSVTPCTTTIQDVWYKFTTGLAGQYQVTVVNTNPLGPFNISVAIFSDCPALTLVACAGAASSTAVLAIPGTAATQYWVRVADFAGEQSPFTIRLDILPAGVCCRGATCTTSVTTSAACTASLVGGQQAGAAFPSGAACNTGNVSNSPCCYANYDKLNGVAVADIFAFLSDWFAGSPFANTGGTGAAGPLAVQNIFDFLTNWFGGGCS